MRKAKTYVSQNEGTYLAAIERAMYREVLHVRVSDRGHLCFLDGRNVALEAEDEDGIIGLVAKPVDGGTGTRSRNLRTSDAPLTVPMEVRCVRIDAKTHLPVSPLVAPTTVNFSGFSFGALRWFFLFRKNSNRLPSS